MRFHDVTIILPAYNEEQSIGKVIDEIRESSIECKIIVGDNASSDQTYAVVKAKGITPIVVTQKGKGSVIRALIRHVDTPYVIMVDSDFTYPIGRYLASVYSALQEDDVVIGYRRWKEKHSMSFTNAVGNTFLSLFASMLFGHMVKDVCSGLWGFKKEELAKFQLSSVGFTLEAELFGQAMSNKCKVGQIPITYRARLSGSKTKLKLQDGTKIAYCLLQERFFPKKAGKSNDAI